MNNKTHITESVAHYRDLLQTIEEEGIGAKVLKGLFGKSAKEIAEKLGPKVVTTSANGEKQIWQLLDNGVYELEGSAGKNATGTIIKPEELAKLNPRRFDTRVDDVVTTTADKPRVTVRPGETQDQAMKRAEAEAEAGRIKGPSDEPRLDFDNVKDPQPHDYKGRLDPRIDGAYTAEEIWKAAAAKQAYVESMIKSGKGKFKEKAIQDQVDAGVPLLDAVDSLQPGKGVKQKIENDPKLRDKFFGAIGSSWRASKRVVIVAVLIALGLWFLMRDKKPVDKKTGDPAQGNQQSDTSSGESSPAGTSIPADQVPWSYLNLKPEAFQGASITKKESMFGDGKWVAVMPDGSTKDLPRDPSTTKKIEDVVKVPPNARMNLDKPFEVFLYGGGDTPDIATSSSDTPSTTWGAR
jgi:hypothetical protein